MNKRQRSRKRQFMEHLTSNMEENKSPEPAIKLNYEMYLDASMTVKRYDKAGMVNQINREDNIPILEEILTKEEEYYNNNLRYLKLKFGKKVPKKHLDETLEEVKSYVDEFLGISPGLVKTCKVSYPGFLNDNYFYTLERVKKKHPLKKELKYSTIASIIAATNMATLSIMQGTINPMQIMISAGIASMPLAFRMIRNNWITYTKRYEGSYHRLPKGKEEIFTTKTARESLIPVLAHEYAHHCKNSLVDLNNYCIDNNPLKHSFDAFDEGLAMGVEKHIAQTYRENEGNMTFEYDSYAHEIEKLARTYYMDLPELRQEGKREASKKNTNQQPGPVRHRPHILHDRISG